MSKKRHFAKTASASVSAPLVITFLVSRQLLFAQDGTWTVKTPMPTARAWLSAGAIEGVLYVVGGYNRSYDLPTLEAYDPKTNSWVMKASWPAPGPFAEGAGTAVDGKLYVLGGMEKATTVQAYDPLTNTWSTKPPMPTGRFGLAAASVDGILYAIGGYNQSDGFLATVEAFDPKTNTWSTKAPMRTPRWILGTAVVDGILYAIGGNNGGDSLSAGTAVEAYDPRTNSWTTKAPMPTPRWSLTAAAIDGIVYAIGGNYFGPVLATVEAYNPKTNRWRFVSPLPTARTMSAAGVIGGSLYAVGGWRQPNEYLSTNEAFTPNRPPIANAGPDQTVECAGRSGAVVTLNGSASSDPDGDPLTFVWKDEHGNVAGTAAIVNVTVPLGSHPFTLTVDDGQGHTASASVNITVRDTTPPTLSVLLTPNVLWPADHKLVPVTASLQMNDVCDANPHYVLVSVTSNEPDNGLGDGDTPDDIQGAALNTDDRSFLLRAERSAKGTGRAYTATYRATDASGNGRTASAQVSVPLNKGK